MRKVLALLAFLAALPAHALSTWGTDIGDLWYNSSEPGWGINITHQQEVVFATLFHYGPNGQTRWYVAPDMRAQNNQFVFTGPLYETAGPYFGGPLFNPANVTLRQVGTASITIDSVFTGFLTYTVDGVFVNKRIERQTFRLQNMTGTYSGIVLGIRTGASCIAPQTAIANEVRITQSGDRITMTAPANNTASCTYAGNYRQLGRMGQIDATVTCAGVQVGTATIFEIEAGVDGYFARYAAMYGTCEEEGKMIGVR